MALETLLDAGGRNWTTRQLVDWLECEHGVRVHPDHLSRLLQARRFGWQRTGLSVTHLRRDEAAYAANARNWRRSKKSDNRRD